jgi:lysophospholipase L1-like esterase
VIGFVQIIRERHADTPLVVRSPIYSPLREEMPNAVGFDLRWMRQEVQAAVETLQAHGDRNIRYVDGLDVLGPEVAHLLPDGLHPNAQGYKVMGRRTSQILRDLWPHYV